MANNVLSSLNSFDYRETTSTIPFIGIYEIVSQYTNIYIYADTSGNDTLYVDFENVNTFNDVSDNHASYTEEYSINNRIKTIKLTPKMKYFRIRIESADTDVFRIYNTFYLYTNIPDTDICGNTPPETKVEATFSENNVDAFGRLRVSNPYTLFDSKNLNVKNTKFSEYLGSKTDISYNFNQSTVYLDSSGGQVIRESKQVFPYQPGKSLLILNTFVMDTSGTNITQRVGYNDSKNGIFLELSDNLYIVKRTYINGSLEESKIKQTDWNVNTMLSSPILDITKAQIFWMDIEWLGVGSVRTGFVINGIYYTCHRFHHANIIDSVYTTTAQLPIRYELINQTSTLKRLKQICSSVLSEGGYEQNSIIRHIGTDLSGVDLGFTNKWTPVIALRLNPNRINTIVVLSQLSTLITTSQNAIYRVLLNPTLTPSMNLDASWNNIYNGDGTLSSVQYTLHNSVDSSRFFLSSYTGGTIINSGFLQTKTVANLTSPLDFNYQIGRSLTNPTTSTYTSDIVLIAMAGTSNNQIVLSEIGWYEY